MREETRLESLSDDELLRRLSELLDRSRGVEADLVAHIGEVDVRRLYAREAAPSMFAYCTEVLHLSEHEAFLRITVARATRRYPVLLAMLRDGGLHLTGIAKLAPHLTPENCGAVLKRAVHRSKRQIEELVAELAPRPEAAPVVRRLPGSPTPGSRSQVLALGPDRVGDPVATGGSEPRTPPGGDREAESPPTPELGPDRAGGPAAAAPGRAASVEAVAPARFRVHVTVSAELRDKLERLQALMRSSVPDGDLAKIIDVAVTEKLKRLEAKRYAKTARPRRTLAGTDTTPKSRYIPAAIRRAVEARDGGRCTFRDERGRRCSERHDLEFHHREPFARGGAHSPRGLTLLCRAHNGLMAERDYGREKMARHRRSEDRLSRNARAGGTVGISPA